jgi:hypothetical protein
MSGCRRGADAGRGRIYANHIQALTLRNHQLEAEIQRLQEQLTRSDPSLRVLRPR